MEASSRSKSFTGRPTSKTDPGAATKLRLLQAGEQMFADVGYADTSVRDLTAEAGANLAAVNYHFGGKENLYIEVCRRALIELRERRIAAVSEAAGRPGATLEDVLEAFCRSFVEPFVESERGNRLMRLWEREMIQSLLPPDTLHNEMLVPMLQLMRQVLGRFCPGTSERQTVLWMHSMVGILIHSLHLRRNYLDMGIPDAPLGDLDEVVDHVVKTHALAMRTFTDGEGCR